MKYHLFKNGVLVSLLSGCVLLVSGCFTAGPDYDLPRTSLPAKWNAMLNTGSASNITDPETLSRWWTVFNDPVLSNLMARASTGNLDLKQSEARLRAARAKRGMVQADRFPTVSANASASRAQSSGQAGGGSTSDMFLNSLDASWELDIFGKKQRALESASAAWEASREELRDVLVSLLAEVALDYVDYRSYQARLAITEGSVAQQEETCQICLWRREAGLISQLDVDQAQLTLWQTKAQLPVLRTGIEQTRNTLALLLGLQPGSLNKILTDKSAIPSVAKEIAVGVPADLLRRRPDVRRAERLLAAQTAEIGVATADRYPSFSLSGSIGLESLVSSKLYTSDAKTAQVTAKATWPLFDAGHIRQNIAVQTALKEEALGAYEEILLTALKDVENALIAYANEQIRLQSLSDAVKAGQRALALARDQYTSGLVDIQTVLDTQRNLLSAEDSQATSTATITSNLIRLYKALGGGWDSMTQSNGKANATISGGKP